MANSDLLFGDVLKLSYEDFQHAKEKLSNAYRILSMEQGKNRRGDGYLQINYIQKSSPQTQNHEWVRIFYKQRRE